MINPYLTPIGLENPAKTMETFQLAGNETLANLRNIITAPHSQKILRSWGIIDTAKMIGVSVPTFKKYAAQIAEQSDNDLKLDQKKYTLKQINEYRRFFKSKFGRPENSSTMICAITNFKGGCGKTTTAVHLAQKCALEGIRTLLVDFDPQGTSTFICGGIIPDLELNYEDTIEQALVDDPNDILRVIRKSHFDGLDIIPANLALQDIELILPNPSINNLSTLGNPAYRLTKALDIVKDQYDIILIDCGPNLGILTINAIAAANGLLVPIPPNMLDYASFVMLSRTLQNLFEGINTKLDFFRILLTKHAHSNEASNVENMMRTIYGGYILNNCMCDTVEISKATNDISTVYEVSRPRGSREAYRRAITHLDNVNQEIIDLFKQIWDAQTKKQKDLVTQGLEECING